MTATSDFTIEQVAIDRLRLDASVQGAFYGFSGDPGSPLGDRYYGYLLRAGGY